MQRNARPAHTPPAPSLPPAAPPRPVLFFSLTQHLSAAVDEMGGRIDELEKSIGDIMQQAGIEDEGGATSGAARED